MPSPHDHEFKKLLQTENQAEQEKIFSDLLKLGPQLLKPLHEFIEDTADDPRVRVLVELLGKIMHRDAIPYLVEMLDSEHAEVRSVAANGLGWNRAVAGLEALDRVEGHDSDENVRREARAAIEEILREFPKQRATLKYHQQPDQLPLDPKISGEYDEVPTNGPDADQRLALMATLPRLLAQKYEAVPIHFSPGGKLHLAVAMDGDRQALSALADLTGHVVELHRHGSGRIKGEIARLYTLGDDDFTAFVDDLTPRARDEVVACIIAGIQPDQPICPLDEANDAVEAIQSFLTLCCSQNVRGAQLKYTTPKMMITLDLIDDTIKEVTPPVERLRERFLNALRIMANVETPAGLATQEGRIRIALCQPKFTIHLTSDKSIGEELVKLRVEKEA